MNGYVYVPFGSGSPLLWADDRPASSPPRAGSMLSASLLIGGMVGVLLCLIAAR